MIAFDYMLVKAAKEVGIVVPPDLSNYDPKDYKRWALFCNAQVGQPMPTSYAHWDNAKVIAGIEEDKLMSITFGQLIDLGFQIGFENL